MLVAVISQIRYDRAAAAVAESKEAAAEAGEFLRLSAVRQACPADGVRANDVEGTRSIALDLFATTTLSDCCALLCSDCCWS